MCARYEHCIRVCEIESAMDHKPASAGKCTNEVSQRGAHFLPKPKAEKSSLEAALTAAPAAAFIAAACTLCCAPAIPPGGAPPRLRPSQRGYSVCIFQVLMERVVESQFLEMCIERRCGAEVWSGAVWSSGGGRWSSVSIVSQQQ